MGKSYRNCNSCLIQTDQPSTPPEGPSRRKESITNYNLSANMASRTKEKSGEFISSSPNSEKQPESFLPSKKKIPEDCSKALPSSTECTDTDFSPKKNSNSITSSVSLSTNSWTRDFKPVSIKKDSKPNPSIKPESSFTKDTLKSARISLTPTSSLLEPPQRRKSTSHLFLLSRQRSPAEPAARKIKEKSQLRNDLYQTFNVYSYHLSSKHQSTHQSIVKPKHICDK